MNSSPTSSFDGEGEGDTDLFPESNTINDPTVNLTSGQMPQNDHLNATAPGELSPPRSQGTEHSGDAEEAVRNVNGHATTSGRTGNNEEMAGLNLEAQAKPGAGWKTKRAQEEYQRAWEGIQDKDFDLSEFGDVMAKPNQQQGK